MAADMRELSDRQRSIFDFIARNVKDQGYPPTIREIGDAVGLRSTCTVYRHLKSLEREGYIRRPRFGNRAIEIIRGTDYSTQPVPTVNLPLITSIGEDTEFLDPENIGEVFALSTNLAAMDEGFVLRVTDSGMSEAGILPGDLVVVHPQDNFTEGDTVAVRIGDRTAVREFVWNSNTDDMPDNPSGDPYGEVLLRPANSAMKPLPLSEVEILGKVALVMRRFASKEE